MDITREISSAGLGIRKSNNIRVRQPLGEITIAGENIEWIKEYENYILDEINAKKIILDKDTGSLFNLKVKIN